MIFKKINLTIAACALSMLSLSTADLSAASRHRHDSGERSDKIVHAGFIPAQAIYQDETAIVNPIVDLPIPFTVRGFKTNIEVNFNQSVFIIKVPGLYSLDAFLVTSVPALGNSVSGFITVNEKQLLPFFSTATSTTSTTVDLHFNDRLVYLKEGDRVSVVLSAFSAGTTILSRGLSIIALNNSIHCSN